MLKFEGANTVKSKAALSALLVGGLVASAATSAQAQDSNSPWTYWLGAGAMFFEGDEANYHGGMYEGRLNYKYDPAFSFEWGLGAVPFMEGRDYPAPSHREASFNGRNSPGENWAVKTNLSALWHLNEDQNYTGKWDPYLSLIGGTSFFGKWRDGANWSPFGGPGLGLGYWWDRNLGARADYNMVVAEDDGAEINHHVLLMGFYRFGSEGDTTGQTTGDEARQLGEPSSGPLRPIYFDFDRSDIRGDSQATLSENAKWMEKNRDKRVSLEGHCDERGTNEYNLALGERRARAAFDYLRSLGVPKDQLSTVSFGEEIPADPGHNEAAWSKNRRVESVIKK